MRLVVTLITLMVAAYAFEVGAQDASPEPGHLPPAATTDAGSSIEASPDPGTPAEAPPADGFDPPDAQALGSETASSEDLDRAREIFQRGIEAAERREFDEAIELFQSALAIHDAPAIRFNLASALYERGRLEEAFDFNRSVMLTSEADPDLRRRSRRLESTLMRRLGRLTVVLVGETRDVAVTVDGAPLPADRIGVERPMRPGTHVMIATHEGSPLTRREVNLHAGASEVVELHLYTTPAEAAQAVSQAAGDAPESETPALIRTALKLLAPRE